MASSVTVSTLRGMKQQGEKIAVLTAYDAAFARVLDEAGVDVVLVGDTLGMVVQGQRSTVPVTVADMTYHIEMVSRGLQRALLVGDLPFMSYATPEQALENAATLMRAGAQVIKLEGGEVMAETIYHLSSRGIPVCAHIGLLPQSVNKLGGYRFQGKTEDAADLLRADATAVEEAGADMIVFECIPTKLARDISQSIQIPTIGIGAGAACDGQVLVLYDLLGISARSPSFSKNYLSGAASIQQAIGNYVAEVKSGSFPDETHTLA